MAGALSPFVYWAQTEDFISLRVALINTKNPNIALHPTKLTFSAQGHGAKGVHDYAFSLDFNQTLDPEESSYKTSDREVLFTLKKVKKVWWSRLTATPQKPAWLKIDFERWKSEDGDEEEETRDIINDYPDLYKNLHKEELGYIKENYKKVYLLIYNLFQFVGFTFVFTVLSIQYYRDGPNAMLHAYESVGSAMKFVQMLQILEIMHVMFGYTKGGLLAPLIQTLGRAFILFCMIDAEPRMHSKPVVFYLFMIWSSIELIRYPYYISQLYKIDVYPLTWLRYTVWIPLYPLGILCEGVVILRNIPYFEETMRYSVSLPNAWNFAFHLPTFLKIYLAFVCFPVMYFLMMHMYRARCKKLGIKSWKKFK
ncbi:Very-long-chain (3R)-3-hydroxyacyl-CoA dehydratase 3 [Frankliniella fusca]|uniref:Very-long-chain (3R)-3-hydroxyacyl-CoA dehydratase n=1 Tax=Frankliniella fusca TaxID=407009 RepID=A0AAE1I0D8_9NEOP|nr:Very-long-chain (3R)-3-hydroxyacyl-CoA dehydratase 3 [Frankliniella fusca]